MIVKLARLRFDHPEGHALHIRHDSDTAAPENAAAFALSTTPRRISILAELRFRHRPGERRPSAVDIRAVAQSGDFAMLGNVSPFTIDVPRDDETSGPIAIGLSTTRLHEAGVGRYDVAWDWEFRVPGSREWVRFEASEHLIYVTLAPPTRPWTQATETNFKRFWPWARALDWACDWGSGVTLTGGLDRAQRRLASKIENGVHGLGEQDILSYDGGSSGNFIVGASTDVFKITRFLRVLEGQAGELPADVYCSECAAAVAVFANCVGADLTLLKIRRRDSSMMELNRVLAIGSRRSSSPSFRFHEITVRPARRGQQVFDACLQPDWDVNLRNTASDFRLTQGKRLGGLRLNRRGTTYLHRLLEPDEPLWEQVEVVENAMPALDSRAAVLEPVITQDDRLKILFRQEIDRLSPEVPPDNQPIPIIRAIKLPGFRVYKQVDSMSHLEELRPLVADYRGFAYTAFRPNQPGSDFDPDRRFRLSVAWSANVANAREALAWLMTRTDKPLKRLARADKKPLGDIAFATPGARMVFILRGNAFARLVSTGRRLVPMGPIAERLDRAFVELRRAGKLGSIEPRH